VLLAEFEEPTSFRASPLAACFDQDLFPGKPKQVAENIWAATLQCDLGNELFLTSLFKIPALSRLALRTPALRNMLHSGPSFHELGLFYHLLTLLQAEVEEGEPRFEQVVLDMPATGHTLALTGLPAIMLRLVTRGPIARALRAGQAILNDPQQSAACVVTLPEPLPVSECLELVQGLRRTNMVVGEVIVNRIPHDPFLPEERPALDELLAARPVRGLTLVERIRRARGSLGRLERSLDVPLIRLPELTEPDPSRSIAELLLAEN